MFVIGKLHKTAARKNQSQHRRAMCRRAAMTGAALLLGLHVSSASAQTTGGFNSIGTTVPFAANGVNVVTLSSTNGIPDASFAGTVEVAQAFGVSGAATFNGAVVIGTPATANILEFTAPTGTQGVFTLANGGGINGATAFVWNGNRSHAAQYNLYIANSGNVGIGTETPLGPLHVHAGTNQNLIVQSDWTGTGGETINSTNDKGNANAGLSFAATKFDLVGGNVGINNSNPSYTLDVNGAVRASAYYHNSDARLKMDIHPIDNALDKVMALRGVTFTWKQDGRPDMGVVAQDVAKVFPDIVSRGTDGQGMMAVEYDSLAGPMIESIRELKMENEAMKAELVSIKATLKAMQDKDARMHDAAIDFQDRVARPSSTVEP